MTTATRGPRPVLVVLPIRATTVLVPEVEPEAERVGRTIAEGHVGRLDGIYVSWKRI